MNVTLYKRPHGHTSIINITKITDEDATWFDDNEIKVSMELTPVGFAVYADCGYRLDDDPDEDPDEVIVIARRNQPCEDVMKELREDCVLQLSDITRTRNPVKQKLEHDYDGYTSKDLPQ